VPRNDADGAGGKQTVRRVMWYNAARPEITSMTVLSFPVEKRRSKPAADLALGVKLSMSQGREIQPLDIFRLLNGAKLKAVLIGGHAVNARTGRPRATVDVDLIGEKPKKVVEILARAYPHLRLEDHPVVFRFKDADLEAIDVIKPQSSPLFKRVLKATEQLKVGGVELTIPNTHAMLALKFASMISPTRKIEDKYVDGRDFILIAKGAGKLDDKRLDDLGESVYAGGGKDLLKLVADARAGKRLTI
jgi:hypothetical protein